jgi:uncharacterized protein involved in tellurium resistance
VTLTRLQSAIGALTVEAACSAEVGDLRLGCAFALRSGATSTVQLSGGNRFGPRDAVRPLLVAGRDQFERIGIDLRQSQDLERLAVYAFSESRTALHWGGTLLVSTGGVVKIEVPLDLEPDGGVAVLLSIYNVRGEFVVRSESERFDGSIRDACRAYGYDRIAWLDDSTPLST